MQVRQLSIRHALKSFLIFLTMMAVIPLAQADNRVVNLTVGYKNVNFAGKKIQAIAFNNQIPGPVLHFKQGDDVTINVYNHINHGTGIHWHGLILPWKMDGVPGITQKLIPPGGVFHYRFTLHQSGTYWYHAHADLQEQKGLYGGIIIDPPKKRLHYNKDFVIVLSDWTNTSPHQVYANLKKEGDFYAIDKPMQPSLVQFFRDYHAAKTTEEKKKILDAYKMMQSMLMSIYDISDVAYDAFLLNGHPPTSPWNTQVKVGDMVRLRFIDAGANTSFHVKIPGRSMQMVQADGNDVRPYTIKSLTIAPGETFDVLVKISKNRPYVIYAESADSLGKALGVLLTQPHQTVAYKSIKPFPKPKPVMMMNHASHSMGSSAMQQQHQPMLAKSKHVMSTMSSQDKPHAAHQQQQKNQPILAKSKRDMSTMSSQDKPHAAHQQHQKHQPMLAKSKHDMPTMSSHDKNSAYRKKTHSMMMHSKPALYNSKLPMLSSNTKYDRLVSLIPTNNPNTPVKIIHMDLGGFMDRYIWFLNGKPFYKAKPIMIKHGQWYRIIFTNNTMMNHPMHIHGHWFILRNGHGAYDPKLHTIDVPPGATVVADLHADTSGQWFFHCHNLLHMKAGMANIFRYQENPAKDFTGLSGQHSISWFYANELEINGDFFNQVYEATLNTLIGTDYNKLQLHLKDAEIENGKITHANMDVFYWHLISPYWALTGGLNYVYRPASAPYLQPGMGIEGLMSYYIQTDIHVYLHDESIILDLELARNTQITHRFFLRLSFESIFATKNVSKDEIGRGLNSLQWIVQPYYQVNPNISLYLQYQHTNYYGDLNHMLKHEGETTQENTYSVGVSLLF